jgi:hypothetical protein
MYFGIRTYFSQFCIGLLTASSVSVGATEIEMAGELEAEIRLFAEQLAGEQPPERIQPSAILNAQLSYESPDRRRQFSFAPFARIDSNDGDRSHIDLREAYWRHADRDWELLIGINKVFWGVTESRHLVNVINQIDQLEDVDSEDFLGQPMAALTLYREWGEVSLFALPWFRPRSFVGPGQYLGPKLPVDENRAQYHDGTSESDVGIAIRYSHTVGDLDLGASFFHGIGREPTLLPDSSGLVLIPHYNETNQAALDLQLTRNAILWKFEGIVREGQGKTFAAAVGGLEYTFFQTFGSAADVSLLAEFLYDGRDDAIAPVTHFQNDLFVGLRIGLNDTQNSSLLAGATVDLSDGSKSIRVEAERRLSDKWSAGLQVQLFVDIDPENSLNAVSTDSFVNVGLHYFF